jgi:hypothetical protein
VIMRNEKRQPRSIKRTFDCDDVFELLFHELRPTKERVKELREHWRQCGKQVMQTWMDSREFPGKRPACWWLFAAPATRDNEKQPNEHDALDDWGLLLDWERVAIDAQWRQWFGRDYFEE